MNIKREVLGVYNLFGGIKNNYKEHLNHILAINYVFLGIIIKVIKTDVKILG